MEPLIIRVGPGGASEAQSPDPELEAAAALQSKGDCEGALPPLRRFVEEYPESSRWLEAIYRLGECEQEEKQIDLARGYFRFVASKSSDDLGLEAALHAVYALELLGRWDDAARDYRALARLPALPEEARAGAVLRRAVCLFRADRVKDGAAELARGMDLYSALPSPSESIQNAAAEARFADAEAKGRRMARIRLEYPQRRMEARVKAKVAALADAKRAYSDVVQIKDPEWAAGAVYRIGELCETFHDQLVAVPPPKSLTPEQRALYAREVERQARPFLQQAFDSYEQVLALGERAGLDSPWVDRSRDRAEALRPRLESGVLTPDPE